MRFHLPFPENITLFPIHEKNDMDKKIQFVKEEGVR